jgi:hypothetical protein
MNLRRVGVLLVVTFAVPVSAIEAQTLEVGQRTRVVVREGQRQDEQALRRELVLRGDVTRFSGDTLFLRPAGTTGELGVPMSSALRLYRGTGVRSRPVSALRNAVIFGIVGVGSAGIAHNPQRDGAFGGSRGKAYLTGAAVGAVFGIVWGALLPTERWERLR